MSKSNAVATVSKGAVVKYDYGTGMAGRGYTGTDVNDFTIPFISILQSNSPQVANESKRISGAVPGMLFNTVTNRLISGKEGFVFVPVTTAHVFGEWVPRNQGGGFRGRHNVGSEVVVEALKSGRKSEKGNRPLTKDGNELVETFYVYGFILDEAGAADFSEMAVLAFTSTKIRKYKKAMTTARTCKALANAPLFVHQWRVKTVQESNSEGEFYNFDIVPAIGGDDAVVASAIPPQTDEGQPHPLLAAALKLEEQILGGVAKADEASLGPQEDQSKDSVF